MVERQRGAPARRSATSSSLCVNRVPELRSWTLDRAAGTLRIGAAVTYAELAAAAARRPRAGARPGGAHGRLAADPQRGDDRRQRRHVLAGRRRPARARRPRRDGRVGERRRACAMLPIGEFMVGVKQTALRPGELLTAVTVPLLDGWQGYAKVGVRNAMVIAISGACLAVDEPSAVGAPRARVGRPDDRAGAGGGGVRRRGRRLASRSGRRRGASPSSGASPPRRAARSTTTARRPPTAATRSTCSPGACCAGRSPSAVGSRLGVSGALPAARQRRSTTTSPTRGSARACSTCCASGSACTARRGRASRGSAARAACSSTASWCAPASCSAASAVDVPIVTIEGIAGDGEPADRRAAGVRRRRRRAVRVLHARGW